MSKKVEKVMFQDNGDNSYDVLICYVGSEDNYDEKYGTLEYDAEQEAWVLNYKTVYGGDGVTYYENLKETEEEIKEEILNN